MPRAKGITFQKIPCQLQPRHPGRSLTQAFRIAHKGRQGQQLVQIRRSRPGADRAARARGYMGQPLMHARHGAGRKIKPIAKLGQDQRLKPHIIRNHALSAPGQMADQGNEASKGARMGFAFR